MGAYVPQPIEVPALPGPALLWLILEGEAEEVRGAQEGGAAPLENCRLAAVLKSA
jgi:hypothetical protein